MFDVFCVCLSKWEDFCFRVYDDGWNLGEWRVKSCVLVLSCRDSIGWLFLKGDFFWVFVKVVDVVFDLLDG